VTSAPAAHAEQRKGHRGWALLAVAATLYVMSYGFFRGSHQLVHRISFAGSVYSEHYVAGGSAWFMGQHINDTLAWVYSPLRWLETAAWYVVRPPGSQLLARHRPGP